MRVELTKSIQSSQGWGGIPGSVVEIADEVEAQKLLLAGYAKPVDGAETATAAFDQETATSAPQKRRR